MALSDRGQVVGAIGVDRRIDAIGWGLFFLWVGIGLAAHVGWSVGLLGVAVITIGVQLWRKYLKLRMDAFWLILGGLFGIVGIACLLGLRVDVVPLLFIAAGLFLLVSTLRFRRASGTGSALDAHRHA